MAEIGRGAQKTISKVRWVWARMRETCGGASLQSDNRQHTDSLFLSERNLRLLNRIYLGPVAEAHPLRRKPVLAVLTFFRFETFGIDVCFGALLSGPFV